MLLMTLTSSIHNVIFQKESVTCQVVDVKVVLTRQGGRPQQQSRIAECLIGDQTGVIIFTARNEQGTDCLHLDYFINVVCISAHDIF